MINTLFRENCLETMRYRLNTESVDLTVTSPPYDNLRAYEGYSFPFEDIARELFRVTKRGGVVVWVVGDSTKKGSESGTSFRQALFFQSIGFKLHDTMIYAKKNFIPLTHNRYEQAWEYMFCFSKGRPKTFNPIRVECKDKGIVRNARLKGSNTPDGGYRRRDQRIITNPTKLHTNIFYYSTGSSGAKHPAPFPEQLALDQISTWSNVGDLVYDPFSGSGTTPRAARILTRNWIASEISEQYCTSSTERINKPLPK